MATPPPRRPRGPESVAHTQAPFAPDNEWGYSTRLVDLMQIMAVKDGVLKKSKEMVGMA